MPDKIHWIIGASSGIGKAVAEAALHRGEHVILSARDEKALHAIAKPHGPLATVLPLDITDEKAVLNAIQALPSPLASVQIYVGTYTPAAVIEGSPKNLHQTVLTNLTAPLFLVQTLLPVLRAQTARIGKVFQSGSDGGDFCDSCSPSTASIQGSMCGAEGKRSVKSAPNGPILALCGSVAGYVGLPKGQPYSATKAALMNFAQSLRAEELAHARRNGVPPIDVRLISPGFVRTRLTAKNDFTMPFLIEPTAAAASIWRQLAQRGRFNMAFPLPMALIMTLLRALPYRLYFTLFGR